MNNIIKTNQGLAWLYLLSITIILFSSFKQSLTTIQRTGDWLLFLCFVLIALMLVIISINESKKVLIAKEINYSFLVVGTLIVLFIFASSFFRRSRALSSMSSWGSNMIPFAILLMTVIYMPIIAFKNNISGKAKVVTIIMAVLFLVYYLYPLLYPSSYKLAAYFGQEIKLLKRIEIFMLVFTYILCLSNDMTDGTMMFMLCAGLGLMRYAVHGPMTTGFGNGSGGYIYQSETAVGFTDDSTFFHSGYGLKFNFLALLGFVLILVPFIDYLFCLAEIKKENKKRI